MGRASAKLLRVLRSWVSRLGLCILCALVHLSLSQTATHTVVPGDTLYNISQRYSTSVSAIVRLNALAGSTIRVGQQLNVPQGSSTNVSAINQVQTPQAVPERNQLMAVVTRAPVEERFEVERHSIAKGETLSDLSRQYDLSIEALQTSNPSLHGAFVDLPLTAGLSLVIPPDEGFVITLLEGENLLGIALKHGIGITDLAKVNRLESTTLDPGHLLFIPDKDVIERFLAEPLEPEPQLEPVAQPSPSFEYVWPLSGRITSAYGHRNISVGGNTFHSGIDIAASSGTEITAAKAGSVSRSGWGGAYGYVVYVDHADGSQTRYAHMSNMAVEVGAIVSQGEVLGWVGSTGASTGPHLHFEIRINSRSVDPLGYLRLP